MSSWQRAEIRTGRSRGWGLALRIAMLWLVFVPLGAMLLTQHNANGRAELTVLPLLARPGNPIIASYQIRNPEAEQQPSRFELWAEGRLLAEGESTLPGGASSAYQYIRAQPLGLGEQVKFAMRAESARGEAFADDVAMPPYTPQVWSSFVSFAAFSTTVMSSMTSMAYYDSTFGPATVLNIGFVMTMVLTVILIFLEITTPLLLTRQGGVFTRLRPRLDRLSTVLLVIFVGMAFTRVALQMLAS